MRIIHKINTVIRSLYIITTNKNVSIKGLLHNSIEDKGCIATNNGSININSGLNIKKYSRIEANGGKITIGNKCFINRGVMIISHDNISIGNNVAIGPNVCIYDHDHDYDVNGLIPNKYKNGSVSIGNNVWIGAGSIILRNTIIGDNSIIGAGTIVKGNVKPKSIALNKRKLDIIDIKKYKI